MYRIIFLAAVMVAACGDNRAAPGDAPDPVDGSVPDGSVAIGPCLDRPTELAGAPAGQLPCELLPPGFQP